MDFSQILRELDGEISRLQHLRDLLSGTTADATGKPKRGRPKGSGTKATAATSATKKRKLSPEGRKAIADAMKRRWAERRKAA